MFRTLHKHYQLAIVLSSLLGFGFFMRELPNTVVWQISIVILTLLLLFSNKWILSKKDKGDMQLEYGKKWWLIFIGCLFIQLLLHSTGGIFSPLLFFVHIGAIGLGFALGFETASLFIFFTVAIFVIDIFADPESRSLWTSDPWSIVLYMLSIVILLPLLQLVTHYYSIKDRLVGMLQSEVKLWEQKQRYMLEGVNELVLVVNQELEIVLASDSFSRSFGKSLSHLIGKSIFEVLTFIDFQGNRQYREDLHIDRVLEEKHSLGIDNLWLLTDKNFFKPEKIRLQIRPVVDSQGRVEQLYLIINRNQDQEEKDGATDSFRGYLHKFTERIESIVRNSDQLSKKDLELNMYLLRHSLEDINLKLHMKSIQPTDDVKALQVSETIEQIAQNENHLAYFYDVAVFIKKSKSGDDANYSTVLKSKINTYWFEILVSKLVEVQILLCAGYPGSVISIECKKENDSLLLTISCPYKFERLENPNWLLQEDYVDFKNFVGDRSRLGDGSGMEGMIAKSIASVYEVPLRVFVEENNLYMQMRFEFT